MSKRNDKNKLSDAQLEQRRKAPRKHGVIAFRNRGADALDPAQKSHFVEILQQLESKEGAVGLMVDRAAKAVMMADLADAWLREKYDDGKGVLEQPIMARYGTLQAEARRCLLAVINILPAQSAAFDAELEHIGKVVDATKKINR